MKYKKSLVLFLIIITIVTGLTFYTAKNKDKVIIPKKLDQPIKESTNNISITPTNSQADYSDWDLFRNGYSLPLPPGCKNTSDKGGTEVNEIGNSPKSTIGSIQKISITVLSDKKSTGQRFTTQREFEDWLKVEGEVQGSIQKLDNLMIDNERAIELLDQSGGENEWMIITWIRKDNKNIYINFEGNQKYNTSDASAIDYILSNFKFIAPPMTGSKK